MDRSLRSEAWRPVILAGCLAALPCAARADLYVRSPLVEYRELEFEHYGFYGLDRKGSPFDGGQSYVAAVGYGVLPFWKVEVEPETGNLPGGAVRYLATTIENTFQLTPDGKYFANLGLFVEYTHSAVDHLPSSFAFGPIIQKQLYGVAGLDSLHTLNVFLSREVGHDHTNGTGLFYAAQSKVLLNRLFNPGVEAFGSIGDVAHAGRYSEQEHSVGPVITGEYLIAPYGKVKYELGYQIGLTRQTVRDGIRWKLEYEIAF